MKIRDVAIPNMNNSPNDEWDYINYLDTSNCTKNEIFNIQKIRKGDYPSRARRVVKENDIIISTVRPNQCHYAIIKYPVENMVVSTGFTVLTPKEHVIPEYLYFYLSQNSITETLSKIADNATTSYPSVETEDILNLSINLPSKDYQKKVVNILWPIEEKIQLNKKINTELENLAKTIYNYWFVQFDFPNTEGKPYKTSGGEMVWNEELRREIPKGWEVYNLKNNPITEIIKPGISEFEGEKTYLPTAEVSDLNINFFAGKITYKNRESRANMKPEKNSIWFAKMKKSKKLIFIGDYSDYLVDNFIFSTGFLGLKCKKEFLEYLFCFVNDNKFEEIKDNLASGATQQAINNDSLEFIPLLIPDFSTIMKFHNVTNEILNKIYMNFLENQELIKLRDFLLPLLMNGQVKIKSEAILRQAQEEISMAAEPQVKYGK